MPQDKYEELFPNTQSKADAFDKIAKLYYCCNFGSTSKGDIDLLMFSIYLEQILAKSQADWSTYSDYTLSKDLGITQSRINALKVKKQLKFPYKDFDWKVAFEKICEHARYEDGKIKLFIPDKNLFLEIKNEIEKTNGFIEVQLNSSLLVVSPGYFIDLLLSIKNDEDREQIRKDLRKQLKGKNLDAEYLEKESFGAVISTSMKNIGIDFICGAIEACIPIAGKSISNLIRKQHERREEK